MAIQPRDQPDAPDAAGAWDDREGRPRLFAVHLGGEPVAGRLSEDHETVLVVARDVQRARARARAKWRGQGRAHVDAVREVHVVDGYEVHLAPSSFPECGEVDLTYEPGE